MEENNNLYGNMGNPQGGYPQGNGQNMQAPNMQGQMNPQGGYQQAYGQNMQGQMNPQGGYQQGYGQNMQGQMNPQGGYQQAPMPSKPKKTIDVDVNKMKDFVLKNKMLMIICGAALLLLIICVCVLSSVLGHGKQSSKGVAKALTAAYEKNDANKIYKLYDKKLLKYMDVELDRDKDDIIDDTEDSLDYFIDRLDSEDVGDIKNIKYKIKRVKNASKKDLREMKEYFKDEYDINISKYAEVKLEWNIIGEDDDIDYIAYVYVYKRGGKWYLYNYSSYEDN